VSLWKPLEPSILWNVDKPQYYGILINLAFYFSSGRPFKHNPTKDEIEFATALSVANRKSYE
jgi:hypothetical protein